MDEELDNNLIIVDGVPETSSEDVVSDVDVDASEDVDVTQNNDVDNSTEQPNSDTDDELERKIQERANALFEEKVENRLIRDRVKHEEAFNKQLEKYKHLEKIISTSIGTNNLDDTINKMADFYREQGVDVPNFNQQGLSERQERILAEAEAKEIIENGQEEMRIEADRISKIPFEKRTLTEKIIFKSLVDELIARKNIQDLAKKRL